MAYVNVVEAGRVQSWIRKTIKQKMNSSTWDQLSNRYEYSQTVPKSGNISVPKEVVHKITDELKMGQYAVTMLAIRKTGAAVIGGANSAEGKESKPTTKIVSLYFTNQRVPKSLPDMSVSGDMSEFYGIAQATVDMIGNDFVEQTDYDHQSAMIDGCDFFLQDAASWQSSEYGSAINAPQTKVLHPNTYRYAAATGLTKNTWSTTYATANTNLATAVASGIAVGDVFTTKTADQAHLLATRTIVPMGGVGGKSEVNYVLKISDAQWFDWTTDTTTSVGWRDLMKYTETGMDRLFNGFVGVYKGMMVITDQRSPLYNVTSSTAGAFQYQTPLADNRVRLVTAANTGTREVFMVMGRGAIGLADVMEMDLVRKSRDYEFVKSICGHRKRGTQRMDLDATVAPTTGRVNESSFIGLTATSAITVG
ncbi:MAG: hypothetical protein M3Y08_01290 [Fibrobacterota bacterium]|nr:hypothetical protein [Fibrobacterota bacterium]